MAGETVGPSGLGHVGAFRHDARWRCEMRDARCEMRLKVGGSASRADCRVEGAWRPSSRRWGAACYSRSMNNGRATKEGGRATKADGAAYPSSAGKWVLRPDQLSRRPCSKSCRRITAIIIAAASNNAIPPNYLRAALSPSPATPFCITPHTPKHPTQPRWTG